MKPYLDTQDSFYSLKHEAKTSPKKDYAGIDAVIFTFTVISIVIGLSIYTAWQITYGFGTPVQVTILAGSSEPNTNHFEPETLTIHKGDTVKWINNDSGLHTVTSGKPTGVESGIKFDSSYLQSGESWTHTFKKTGNFDYYCTLHPYMTAKIKVIK